ncbi:hypothetical protein MTR67_022661 [Solanum verrucosum]|uniref:Integrase catalytic domain-containing protein n=1 Tax=Solanum verrucosum TaxID=315347 RepID=A0AAF0QZC9_SOLVR|nr:hypothetical protein MTR67_022661 [Solanum verrucosum]
MVSKEGIWVDPTKIEAVRGGFQLHWLLDASKVRLGGILMQKGKFDDEMLCLIRDKVLRGEAKEVALDSDGVLRIEGLPITTGGYDFIWVVVDRLIKSSHSILVWVKYTVEKLAELLYHQIVQLYGVSVSIVYDQGSLFTSHFWYSLQHGLGTRLDMSTTFYPHTNVELGPSLSFEEEPIAILDRQV